MVQHKNFRGPFFMPRREEGRRRKEGAMFGATRAWRACVDYFPAMCKLPISFVRSFVPPSPFHSTPLSGKRLLPSFFPGSNGEREREREESKWVGRKFALRTENCPLLPHSCLQRRRRRRRQPFDRPYFFLPIQLPPKLGNLPLGVSVRFGWIS